MEEEEGEEEEEKEAKEEGEAEKKEEEKEEEEREEEEETSMPECTQLCNRRGGGRGLFGHQNCTVGLKLSANFTCTFILASSDSCE